MRIRNELRRPIERGIWNKIECADTEVVGGGGGGRRAGILAEMAGDTSVMTSVHNPDPDY